MIDTSYVLFYQFFLNFLAIGFLLRIFPNMREGEAKFYFGLISFTFLIYGNLLCMYYFPLQDQALAAPVSKGIFASSIVYVTLLVHLLFLVVEPRVTRAWHYKLFLVSQAFFFISSFTPYFQSGLTPDGPLLKPVHGPLYKAFIISYFFWWIYVFGTGFYYFRKQREPRLRKQTALALFSVFLMLTLTLLTNGLLPALYGSSQLSLLGALWYLFFLVGIGLIIFQIGERTLKNLQAELELLYKNLAPENKEAMLQSLSHLIYAFDGKDSYSFKKRARLVLNNHSPAHLYISRVRQEDEEVLDITKTIPIRWLEGIIDSLKQLEQDNFGLALGLQKMLREKPHGLDGKIAEYLPASMREDLNAYAVQNLLAPELEQQTNLSPLEIAEKRVIAHYLAKNHYNKNRTRKELAITVNTLNAKIRKYKLRLSQAKLIEGTSDEE